MLLNMQLLIPDAHSLIPSLTCSLAYPYELAHSLSHSFPLTRSLAAPLIKRRRGRRPCSACEVSQHKTLILSRFLRPRDRSATGAAREHGLARPGKHARDTQPNPSGAEGSPVAVEKGGEERMRTPPSLPLALVPSLTPSPLSDTPSPSRIH